MPGIICYSKIAWIISLLVFVIIDAAIVLSAHSPGWTIVSVDGTHVDVSRRTLRLFIPSSDTTGSDDGFINAYDTLGSDQANRTVEDRLAAASGRVLRSALGYRLPSCECQRRGRCGVL